MTYLLPTILKFGLPLLAVPLLIHLINLRRRQRIEWAAMEFLLESQKRNKKWIVLRQLLLWLLRTLAVAIIVGMLAKPVIQPAWARLFGAGITHHVVLLDDSYSMTDRWEETNAFTEAKAAILRLLTQANDAQSSQVVTLIRFSEAAKLSVGTNPAIYERALNQKLLDELTEQFQSLKTAESMAGPIEAIEAALRMPEAATDESRIGYVVSDYRRQQWQEESQLKQLVERFRAQLGHLRLVQCVDEARTNLAVTRLEPESGLRAAKVETWYEVDVANYSGSPVSEVTVLVEADKTRLPALRFETISPGETASQRFRVNFETSGPHALTARIDPSSVARDPIQLDNTRYFAAAIPQTMPLLLIDGSQRGDDGYFLKTALSPGGKNLAGWNPQVERIDFLRKHSELGRFAAVFLLDVPQLDRPEIEALEKYVEHGGGLAIFLGPQTERAFYNSQLYREGQGLMPGPIDRPTQLLADRESQTSELRVTEHPLFRMFAGQRNGFLELVRINFYFGMEPGWQPAVESNTKILATLHNDAPFVIEKQLGEGRIVAQLCKLSPRETQLGVWSNWGVNPMFPIYANELAGYLTAVRRQFQLATSGERLTVSVDEADYQTQAQLFPPSATGESISLIGEADERQLNFTAPEPATSGVWRFELAKTDVKNNAAVDTTQVIAVNVPTGEGDLQTLDRSQLAEILKGIDYEFLMAARAAQGEEGLAGYPLSEALFWSLLVVLLLEQLMAVAASYHRAGSNTTVRRSLA